MLLPGSRNPSVVRSSLVFTTLVWSFLWDNSCSAISDVVFFLSPIRPDEALSSSTVSCPAEYVHSYLRVGEAVASAPKVKLLSEFIGWYYLEVKGAGDPFESGTRGSELRAAKENAGGRRLESGGVCEGARDLVKGENENVNVESANRAPRLTRDDQPWYTAPSKSFMGNSLTALP